MSELNIGDPIIVTCEVSGAVEQCGIIIDLGYATADAKVWQIQFNDSLLGSQLIHESWLILDEEAVKATK